VKREDLQHIIRAASEICEEPDFIIIGSQAVHGSLLEIDAFELVRSMEADLYPLYAPEKSQLLNAIGELSTFHSEFGYYADGVDDTTATLPAGWKDRVEQISGPLTQNSKGFEVRGWCLELHDLVISKLIAGRDKDFEFFQALVRLRKVEQDTLLERLSKTILATAKRRLLKIHIEAAFTTGEPARS